jgi:hypothetical protein
VQTFLRKKMYTKAGRLNPKANLEAKKRVVTGKGTGSEEHRKGPTGNRLVLRQDSQGKVTGKLENVSQ